MRSKEFRNRFKELCEEATVVFDYPLSAHNTMGAGGVAAAWYVPTSLEELREVKRFLESQEIKIVVFGNGSNILVPDGRLKAVVVNFKGSFADIIKIDGNHVTVGAGVRLEKLINECCREGLTGLESLTGIPATVGGALINNASYLSAISDCLQKVKVLTSGGEMKWIEKKDIEFGYRFSSFDREDIIVEAAFSLREGSPERIKQRCFDHLAKKKEKQPLDKKTLGCVFKNSDGGSYPSGELLDRAGLKGTSEGGARVSEKHANFIVNSRDATASDIRGLVLMMRGKVREIFGVELETEIEMLDNSGERIQL